MTVSPIPNGAGLPLCAVVVTYHPEPDVVENLQAMGRECGRVLIVDNGSSAQAQAAMAAVAGVTLLPQGVNLGLAAALNLGVARAAEQGCEWVVTFDQDSRPEPGMIAAMWQTHLALPSAAVIGPRIQEENAQLANYRWVCRHETWPLLFRRVGYSGKDIAEVTMLVTSGSMIDIAVWRSLGGFEAGLFIDYIDTDYCLRVIRSGRQVAVAGGALLMHRLGAREKRVFMGRVHRPTHHAAFRHYYIARNRVRIWARHALTVPHWALFDLIFAVYNMLRVVAFESGRLRKLKAMILGTWDGLCRRSGPLPQRRRLSLEGTDSGKAT